MTSCIIPLGDSEDRRAQNYLDMIREELAKFLSEQKLRGIRTVCVMPRDQVQVLTSSFPQMAPVNLRKAIGLSCANKLGMKEEEMYFDFTQAPRSNKGKETTDVIAIAAKKQGVQAIVKAVESAGCWVENVTVPMTQYRSLLTAREETEKSGPSLVIDIDRSSSWFIFFDGDNPRYCKKEERLGEKQMLSSLDSTISLDSGSLRLEVDQAKKDALAKLTPIDILVITPSRSFR